MLTCFYIHRHQLTHQRLHIGAGGVKSGQIDRDAAQLRLTADGHGYGNESRIKVLIGAVLDEARRVGGLKGKCDLTLYFSVEYTPYFIIKTLHLTSIGEIVKKNELLHQSNLSNLV